MFTVSHKSSACLLISTSNCNILCDPVQTCPHYGGWLLYPRISAEQLIINPVDYIFISHIHQDHYDPAFIKKLLLLNKKIHGFIPRILIAKRKNLNFLALKMDKDCLNFDEIETIKIKDTEVSIFPFDTGKKTDIDSALFVKYRNRSVLNLNDIILDQTFLLSLNDQLKTEITLLATSYAGAGPYPHCYSNDAAILHDLHIKKVEYNKNKFHSFAAIFNPKFILPFAGEHLLTGSQYWLNDYRGIYDRFYTKEMDPRSRPLCTFEENYIDLEDEIVIGEHNMPDTENSQFSFYSKLAKSMSYESCVCSTHTADLEHLCHKAAHSLERRIVDLNLSPYTFNFYDFTSHSLIYTLHIGSFQCGFDFSDVYINPLLMKDVLKRLKHWDNLFGGSLLSINRHGSNDLGYKSEKLLSFFHL